MSGAAAPPPAPGPAAAAAERLAAGLFPQGVAVAAWPLARPAPPPWPGEDCGPALPARRAEFAAGRAAARAALGRLGLAPAALPVGPGRAPVWPEGVRGSIAHGGGLALAAAARAGDIRALGLDLEAEAPLLPEVAAEVCREDELAGLGGRARGLRALALFCAREAAFKAQFPLTGRWLGFREVRVRMEPDGRFAVLPEAAEIPGPWPLAGRVAAAGGHVVAAVALPSA